MYRGCMPSARSYAGVLWCWAGEHIGPESGFDDRDEASGHVGTVELVAVVGEQLGDRTPVGAKGCDGRLVPLTLDQADPALGERAGGTAEHLDLEPFDIDLHPGHPSVTDQCVHSYQL